MLERVLFYVFAAVSVLSAIMVITRKNIVHSAMFLAATLLSVAGIFLTLRAEFLAGVQVIVYVGGILVLMVFVIMLVSVERVLFERQYNRQWGLALFTAALLILQFGWALYQGKESFVLPPQALAGLPAAGGNTETVGNALYQTYLLPFEIASILLLVAIIGGVVLAKKKQEDTE